MCIVYNYRRSTIQIKRFTLFSKLSRVSYALEVIFNHGDIRLDTLTSLNRQIMFSYRIIMKLRDERKLKIERVYFKPSNMKTLM